MSATRDLKSLLNRILKEAKDLTRSDGGTIYLAADDRTLKFAVLMNDTLKMHQIAEPGSDIDLPDVRLNKANGEMNLSNVAAASANLGQTIIIDDVYLNESYDFTGTRTFDEMLNYRSRSFLTIALKNFAGDCIGVLQLLNAKTGSGEVVKYDLKQIPLVESLASLASVAIDHRLLLDEREQALDTARTDLEEARSSLSALETKDTVTGLSNRRCLDEDLEHEWRRAKRQKYVLSFCICEVDRYDQILLERGPDFTDASLRMIANELSHCFQRPSDFFGRYGDGSFAMILPYLPAEKAFAHVEKLREAVADKRFIANGERVNITLSSGLASTSDFERMNCEDLTLAAQDALELAGQAGGNTTRH